MAINAQDILDTLANSVTHSTLTPGAAANAGASAKGQEVNAYAKAMKIVKQNTTFINNQSGTDTAAGDAIEEIFFSHQYQSASPYTKSGTGSYTGNVVAGNNTANGFNALFLANAIDQFRQVDSAGASPISAGTDINSTHYQLTQAQGSSNMTITLLDSEAATPTATSGVSFQFRTRGGGTAAAGLKLGTTEIGRATSATTLTLDSGATLGMTNDIEATLYLYAINNGGTIELGVINGQQLDESILHTSTALDGTADSASTLYSDTARTTLAVRLIGRMRITMNAVGTYDEDPTELAIIGVGSSGGSGELASGEKIYWQDTNQFIQGDTTSITIESDDTLTINSDTLASINSDTKNQLTAPTTNVISTTAVDANTPSFIIRNSTGSKPVVTIQNDANDASGPILRLTNNRSADGQDNDQAGLIEFRSKDDGTPSEAIYVQQFANVADASASTKDGLWTLQVMSNNTLTNRLIANSSGVAVTGTLNISGDMTVSGTTTTVDSTVTTYVDPMIELQTAVGGGAPGTETTKDVGLLMNYHNGSAAKQAFAGFDDDLEKFIFIADATESGTQVISGTAGTIHANFTVPDDGTIGSATDSDAIAIASSGVVTFSQSPVIGGTTPKLTIGDAGAEDTMLVFDGNATDVRLGIDDGTDVFEIGTGTTHGSTIAISINTSQVCTFAQAPVFTSGLGATSFTGAITPNASGTIDIGSGTAEFNDIYLADSSVIKFGNDQEITLTHNADKGLTLKHAATADDKFPTFTLAAGDTDMAVNDVIGAIDFVAPDEGTGTDAILTAGSLRVISEGDFSASNNAAKMSFMLGSSAAAAEVASLSSAGVLTTTTLSAGTITETSARELKENITPMSNSLDKIMALQGVNFDWKDGRGGKQIGLIADDVADVVPEVVQFNHTSPTSLQYSKMVALLIEGMKEQQTEIDKLKKLVSKSK